MQAIISLISKFEETYYLHDMPRSGRPSLTEERTDSVIETLDKLEAANPLSHASSSHVALETGISQGSVRRILKENLAMYPYHLQRSQAVTENDKMHDYGLLIGWQTMVIS